MYKPHPDLDPHYLDSDRPYSLAELRELARHHGIDTPLRELGDGRVIVDDWGPASGDEPTVVGCALPDGDAQ
jgi:hypothetical protein